MRLAISSSNYPRFSSNPNNNTPLIKPGPPVVAQNNLHHSKEHSSRLILPIVKASQLPPFGVLDKIASRVDSETDSDVPGEFMDLLLLKLEELFPSRS